jgi:ATP-binding cassette subfamily F protein 3
MIVLSCKNVHKSFGIDIILDEITFNVNEGEKVGFVGSNGAGKSTLFKILTGFLEHDKGEIFFDKNKKIGYLSQNLSLDSTNTIYDEMLFVFEDIIQLEKKLSELEIIMNEPYDKSKEEYHNKIIQDYTNTCDLYNAKGGYTYKAEISKVLNGLGFKKR